MLRGTTGVRCHMVLRADSSTSPFPSVWPPWPAATAGRLMCQLNRLLSPCYSLRLSTPAVLDAPRFHLLLHFTHLSVSDNVVLFTRDPRRYTALVKEIQCCPTFFSCTAHGTPKQLFLKPAERLSKLDKQRINLLNIINMHRGLRTARFKTCNRLLRRWSWIIFHNVKCYKPRLAFHFIFWKKLKKIELAPSIHQFFKSSVHSSVHPSIYACIHLQGRPVKHDA